MVLIVSVFLNNGHASQESFLEGTPFPKVHSPTPSHDHKTLPEGFEESVSFSGAGHYVHFHLGVARYLQETYDLSKVCFLGSSSGSLPATLLAADVSIQDATEKWLTEAYSTCATKTTGVYFNFAEVMTSTFLKYLPSDSHEKASNRAIITLTKAWGLRSKRIAHFTSNQNLLKALIASCHWPYIINKQMFSYFNDEVYLDGGLTDFWPKVDVNTVLVSPYMWSFIWRKAWLLNGMYFTTDSKRNLRLYEDGYKHAAENPEHWLRLEKFRKKTP